MRKAILLAIMVSLAPPGLAQVRSGEDARTHASDDAIRVSRRAYRAECQKHQSDEYCECMTGGMAQSLTPADLDTATALLAHQLADAPSPGDLSAPSVAAANAASAQFEPLCRPYRR